MVASARAKESEMGFEETFAKAQDAVDVRRVHGAPYEKYGATLIPAARVAGGGGGGDGEDASGGGWPLAWLCCCDARATDLVREEMPCGARS